MKKYLLLICLGFYAMCLMSMPELKIKDFSLKKNQISLDYFSKGFVLKYSRDIDFLINLQNEKNLELRFFFDTLYNDLIHNDEELIMIPLQVFDHKSFTLGLFIRTVCNGDTLRELYYNCPSCKEPHMFFYDNDEVELVLLNNILSCEYFSISNLMFHRDRALLVRKMMQFCEVESVNFNFAYLMRKLYPSINAYNYIMNERQLAKFEYILKKNYSANFLGKCSDYILNHGFSSFTTASYSKFNKENIDFLIQYSQILKKDLENGDCFYVYTMPDLKLIKFKMKKSKGKTIIYKNYINPQYIWDGSNHYRLIGAKFFL